MSKADQNAATTSEVIERVRQSIVQQHGLSDLEEIQTGHYSTGYAARQPDGSKAILKLPSRKAWDSRFVECATMLHKEASILATINRMVATVSANATCARVVKQHHYGEVPPSVSGWSQPVPYLIQSFARGKRLSEPGVLPCRDEREADACAMLAQVTGLVSYLAKHNIAHLDIKPDCLFWDEQEQKIDVIDWNSASNAPTDSQKTWEFTNNLRNLVHDVLLGSTYQWNEPDNPIRELFDVFRGLPLSRGARLLLLRLSTTNSLPNMLRNVDDLHTALQELHGYWRQPVQDLPRLKEKSAEAHACLLNQMSIEMQRPAGDGTIPAQRREWYDHILKMAEKYVQNEIADWVDLPNAMRARVGRMEQLWCWLPDIWPVLWIVPIMRSWFACKPDQNDQQLGVLVQYTLNRQWEQLETMLSRLDGMEKTIQPHLDSLRRVARIYQHIETLEQHVRTSPDAYPDVARKLLELRVPLPLEWRVRTLLSLGASAPEQHAEMNRLRKEAEILRDQPLTSERQERLWEVMQGLRKQGGGINDEDYKNQAKIVTHIQRIRHGLAEVEKYVALHDWVSAQKILVSHLQQKDVQEFAPDLYHILTERYQDMQRQAVFVPFEAAYEHLRTCIERVAFDEAQRAFDTIMPMIEKSPALLSDYTDKMTSIAETLKMAKRRYEQVRAGKYPATPEQEKKYEPAPSYPIGELSRVMRHLDELADFDKHVPSLTGTAQLSKAWEKANEHARSVGLPEPLMMFWMQRRDGILRRLEAALNRSLDQASPPSPDDLRNYEATIWGIVAGTEMNRAWLKIQDIRRQMADTRQEQFEQSIRELVENAQKQIDTRIIQIQQQHDEIKHMVEHQQTMVEPVLFRMQEILQQPGEVRAMPPDTPGAAPPKKFSERNKELLSWLEQWGMILIIALVILIILIVVVGSWLTG